MLAHMAMDRYELEHMNRLAGRIGQLEQQLAFVLRHLGISPPPPPPLDEVEQLVAKGDKIAAIALYRKRTGKSLPEAKHAIDEISARLGFA
jgi:hypothetical protein